MGTPGMKNPQNLIQNTPGARLNEAEKENKAIQAMLRGMTYDQAAKAAGYTNRSGAYKAVQRAMARHAQEISENVGALRALEVARLDRILLELSTIAFNRSTPTETKLKYLTAMDRNIQTRAGLLGLNAPIQHEVFTHDAINLRISQLAEELGLPVPERFIDSGDGPGVTGQAALPAGPTED